MRRSPAGPVDPTRGAEDRTTRALHGMARAMTANMVTGVSVGFTRVLEIVGGALVWAWATRRARPIGAMGARA